MNSPYAIETDAYQDFSRIAEQTMRDGFEALPALTLQGVDVEAVPVDRYAEARVTLTWECRLKNGSATEMAYTLAHELALAMIQASREAMAYR